MNQTVYRELFEHIRNLEIIDSHEHLPPEEVLLQRHVDFSTLFSHYCLHDLKNAGMTADEMKIFYGAASDEEKWQVFSRYYPLIHDTGYCKSARLTMAHYYGIEELNETNYALLSLRMRRFRSPGVTEQVLDDCRIRCVINTADSPTVPMGCYFAPGTDRIRTITRTPPPPRKQDLTSPGNFYSNITSVEALDQRAADFVRNILAAGGKAIKMMTSLPYMTTDAAGAKAELDKLYRSTESTAAVAYWPTGHDVISIPLYWYVLHRILDEAAKYDLPIAVHTGYWDDFRGYSPENLIPFLDSHPNNRFDLFHLGYPDVKASLLLAKTRPHVSINLCWTYIISQQFAKDAIRQIVDFIPMNKVIGFGGDYLIPEKIYGHREMMTETMAAALTDKVQDGTLTLNRAKQWAKAMLCDNAARLYKL